MVWTSVDSEYLLTRVLTREYLFFDTVNASKFELLSCIKRERKIWSDGITRFNESTKKNCFVFLKGKIF